MKKNLNITLADYLKEKRLAAGFSQKDVSDIFGYTSPQFISNWERGLSQPPIKIIKKISDVYRVSADELFEVYLRQTIHDITLDMRKAFAASRK